LEVKDLLNTKEIAAYLKINEKKVYQLIQEGSIPCTRAVGKWLFPLGQINRWLEEQTELSKSILIAGSDDPLVSEEGATKLAATCGGRHHQIPDCGHSLPSKHPTNSSRP